MSIEVHIATSDDWEKIKSMRIKSVELHPDVFAPKKHPKDLTIDEWKERATNSASISFLLLDTKDNTPVGLSGIYLEAGNPKAANGHMVSTFIMPSHKGKGLSHLLYEARIEWAKKHPTLERLMLEQRKSNEIIKMVHQKHGFVFLRDSKVKFVDGSNVPTEIYELKLI